MVSLKIGETTKCTLGFFLHNNKFVDQQSGSNVQIVVSGPTSTNCVIPNLPRRSRQLYRYLYCIASCRCLGMTLAFLLSLAALPASSRISAAKYSMTAAM